MAEMRPRRPEEGRQVVAARDSVAALKQALRSILAEVSDCSGAREAWCGQCRIKNIATKALKAGEGRDGSA